MPRLALDAVIGSVGLATAVVADLDEDPDSHDTAWAVATGNNTNTELHCGFPDPVDPLTEGGGLQEFRAVCREFDSGQTGQAKARIELWENGTLVRAGTDANIDASDPNGDVIALAWNATEITSKALVECKVIGTKSGGSPTTRQTVDFGAVEWNTDETEAGGSGIPVVAHHRSKTQEAS